MIIDCHHCGHEMPITLNDGDSVLVKSCAKCGADINITFRRRKPDLSIVSIDKLRIGDRVCNLKTGSVYLVEHLLADRVVVVDFWSEDDAVRMNVINNDNLAEWERRI